MKLKLFAAGFILLTLPAASTVRLTVIFVYYASL